MKKGIIIFILIVLVTGGVIGYRMYQKQTPDVVNSEPDVATDARGLIEAFDKDTAAAGKKYIDRIVEVTGTVKSIDTSGTIILGDSTTESSVTCGLDRRHLKDYEQLKTGSVAVIQGVCAGYEKASGDDLLASLGTTVQLRSAGVKKK
jgi:hypothetical protein